MAHKSDHTRGVGTKQLDDGIDDTLVSAQTELSDLSVSCAAFPRCLLSVVDPSLEN
jgi:hypothetical protein